MQLVILLTICLVTLAHCAVIQNLDFGWKFNFTTTGQPSLKDCSVPQCSSNYVDSSWTNINVPHDFVVLGVFNSKADKAHGYLPYARGWYRRHVDLSITNGQKVFLHFDGTQRNAVVFFNEKYLGVHFSGYTPHEYDVTPYVKASDNLIAVYIDATSPDSWWYDGGGLYRHVYFRISSATYIDPLSVYVPTQVTSIKITGRDGSGIANAQATASVTVVNSGNQSFSGSVTFTIPPYNPVVQQVSVGPGSNSNYKAEIQLAGVDLWSIETPNLQTLKVEVSDTSGKSVDDISQAFGVRDIKFDPRTGFSLNSQPVKIKGMANHQDFAGVGVAVPDSLQKYRVAKLKEMGANAWRTAHNPPNPALLDECDRQGFLVWDENHRNTASGDQWVADLQSLILRDRNHPSVIMWSICNEALCNGFNATSAGILKKIIKDLDPAGNRPISAAMNNDLGSDFSRLLDVVGINYQIGNYAPFHQKYPSQPVIGSETASALSDRGIYYTSSTDKVESAYDVNFPGWGNSAEDAMKAVWEYDYMAGGFIWTGFDYKGEPTPYDWPNINSHFGVIDIAGFPKDAFYYYKSVWKTDEQMVHVFPHWNWKSGDNVNVWVYSNAVSVQLFLNGKSLGTKNVPTSASPMGRVWRGHVEWNVPYQAGNITAIGYDSNGKSIGSDTRVTAAQAAAIKLSVEFPASSQLQSNGVDVGLITCEIVDSNGYVVPTASNVITFTLSGSGQILGTGNGNPNSHDPDYPINPQRAVRSSFNGLARVVIQSSTQPGTITVSAQSTGLRSDSVNLKVQ